MQQMAMLIEELAAAKAAMLVIKFVFELILLFILWFGRHYACPLAVCHCHHLLRRIRNISNGGCDAADAAAERDGNGDRDGCDGDAAADTESNGQCK